MPSASLQTSPLRFTTVFKTDLQLLSFLLEVTATVKTVIWWGTCPHWPLNYPSLLNGEVQSHTNGGRPWRKLHFNLNYSRGFLTFKYGGGSRVFKSLVDRYRRPLPDCLKRKATWCRSLDGGPKMPEFIPGDFNCWSNEICYL